MYQLISRKIKEVTPDVAEQILASNTYNGQRPKSEKHIKVLSDAITNGLFTVGHIAIAHQGWNGGDAMLANGQHQCTAVILTGEPINAVVEEYQCKKPEDFSLLYRQFDNNKSRTLDEVTLPEARALGLNWHRMILKAVMAGIGFIEGHNGLHKNKRVEYLKRYIAEGNFINEILSCVKSPESRHLRRGAIVAAMIQSFKKSRSDAEIFWEEVRDGENLKGNSPSLKLRNYLLSTNTAFGRGVNAPALNAAASYKEMYSKCIIAWNAYRRGDSTQLKFYADKETPKAI
jgi:hypothetical protein